MADEVRYVPATADEPNLLEIEPVCSEMAKRDLGLTHVIPCQGFDGRTVGLWLFFAPIQVGISKRDGGRPLWWYAFRERNKSLGASLTLTGIVSVISGIALHFALQNSWIDTTIHLGYFFGLIGLFLFLIGLVIVV